MTLMQIKIPNKDGINEFFYVTTIGQTQIILDVTKEKTVLTIKQFNNMYKYSFDFGIENFNEEVINDIIKKHLSG